MDTNTKSTFGDFVREWEKIPENKGTLGLEFQKRERPIFTYFCLTRPFFVGFAFPMTGTKVYLAGIGNTSNMERMFGGLRARVRMVK